MDNFLMIQFLYRGCLTIYLKFLSQITCHIKFLLKKNSIFLCPDILVTYSFPPQRSHNVILIFF